MEVGMDELIVTSDRIGCISNGWKEEVLLYVSALSRKIIRYTDTESSLTSLVNMQRKAPCGGFVSSFVANQTVTLRA
jgi:hypothetical protein